MMQCSKTQKAFLNKRSLVIRIDLSQVTLHYTIDSMCSVSSTYVELFSGYTYVKESNNVIASGLFACMW